MCFRTDGYIVCEEHEEILRAAWSEDQEFQKQKEKEVCTYVELILKREKKASLIQVKNVRPYSFDFTFSTNLYSQ